MRTSPEAPSSAQDEPEAPAAASGPPPKRCVARCAVDAGKVARLVTDVDGERALADVGVSADGG
jgi:hypothetical protein